MLSNLLLPLDTHAHKNIAMLLILIDNVGSFLYKIPLKQFFLRIGIYSCYKPRKGICRS